MKTEAIKALENAYQDDHRKRYPNVPDYCRPTTKFNDATANGLTNAILTWLDLNGHKAWRQASEGRFRQGKQYTDVLGHRKQLPGHFIPGTNRGHADISSVIDGRFIAWEIKVGKDRQSQNQKRFQKDIEDSGGQYVIVRSFDEFMEHYERIIRNHKSFKINQLTK